MREVVPAAVMQRAERLIIQGHTVSEAARILRITDPGPLYEALRRDSNLMRMRTVHYEIDLDLIKYKALKTLEGGMDDENSMVRLKAAQAVLSYMVPKKEKVDSMVVINFGMEPPRMPDAPTYIYPDELEGEDQRVG